MMLEDALRFSGYTIDAYEYEGDTITTPDGAITIPPMILSKLTWARDETPTLGAAFYLDKLPPFDAKYAPVQLSMILDRYRSRRLAYETPDEFALAVRRWGTVHLGAMSTLSRRYLSTAVKLPLDTVDMTYHSESAESATDNVDSSDTTTSNSKARDAQSDFPQGTLAGNTDYASGAVDRSGTGTVSGTGKTEAERERTGEETRTERGRSGRTAMELLSEQRSSFLNVDAELLDRMEPLFLGVFDRSTADNPTPHPYRYGRWW